MSYILGTFLLLLSGLMIAAQRFCIFNASDRVALVSGMNLFSMLWAIPLVIWLGPPPEGAIPYLLVSSIGYTGVMVCVVQGFKYADFSHMEPLQAAVKVVGSTILAGLFLNETITFWNLLAIVLVIVAFVIQIEKTHSKQFSLLIISILLISGLMATLLQISDTAGIREVTSKDVASYLAWNLFIGLPVTLWGVVGRFDTLKQTYKTSWRGMISASVLDSIGYAMILFVVYYLALSDIMPLLSSSIVFSTLFGVFILKEDVRWRRWFATTLLVLSIVLCMISF